MINEGAAHLYCRDDISKIENYNKAIADTTQTWHLHHRDEVRILPSGMKVYRSRAELKENGRYYHCPANELIFLTCSEHKRLHTEGKHLSEELRKKLSAANKGKHHKGMKGKTFTDEHRRKMAEAAKRRWARRQPLLLFY